MSRADDQTTKAPLTMEQFSNLFERQPVAADQAIFDGDSFPKIDFVYNNLIKAALGPYTLNVRYFDAAWNEVQKPGAPGRYGAWVDIQFPNGAKDTRKITLFKTAAPYNPAKDPYDVNVKYPTAFGLSKELLRREQWISDDTMNGLIERGSRESDAGAVLLAGLHDLDADPARWHGFSCGRSNEVWWTTLEEKLGKSYDYKFLVQMPDGYDKYPSKKWPLIIFLHGSGERGDDLNVLKNKGPLGYTSQGYPLPFVIVSPQCPKHEWWNPERLVRLLDQIEAAYRIDPKRVYLTGLSMGGFGTFDLAAAYPKKFAAIAPVAGAENPEIAKRLKSVPTCIFHGAEDTRVPTRYSIAIAKEMDKTGGDVKITVYPGVAHGNWEKTYNNPALYDWFLQHVKD